MKKVLVLVFAFILVLGTMPVYAIGKLNIEQENFHVRDLAGVFGFVYAKVANVGDMPIEIQTALLDTYDKYGNKIASSGYLPIGDCLQPNEYTYIDVSDMLFSVDEAADVSDYVLTVNSESARVGIDYGYDTYRFPCISSSYELYVGDGYGPFAYMYATFTNNTDETVYDIKVVMALLDDEGEILRVNSEILFDVGIAPGSTFTYRQEIHSIDAAYFSANGFVPATVDAIACIHVGQ